MTKLNKDWKHVGTDFTNERGKVDVYFSRREGLAYVGGKMLDIDGRPLGMRSAPSGTQVAVAKMEPAHRFHEMMKNSTDGSQSFAPKVRRVSVDRSAGSKIGAVNGPVVKMRRGASGSLMVNSATKVAIQGGASGDQIQAAVRADHLASPVSALRREAQQRGIPITAKATKAQLVEVLTRPAGAPAPKDVHEALGLNPKSKAKTSTLVGTSKTVTGGGVSQHLGPVDFVDKLRADQAALKTSATSSPTSTSPKKAANSKQPIGEGTLPRVKSNITKRSASKDPYFPGAVAKPHPVHDLGGVAGQVLLDKKLYQETDAQSESVHKAAKGKSAPAVGKKIAGIVDATPPPGKSPATTYKAKPTRGQAYAQRYGEKFSRSKHAQQMYSNNTADQFYLNDAAGVRKMIMTGKLGVPVAEAKVVYREQLVKARAAREELSGGVRRAISVGDPENIRGFTSSMPKPNAAKASNALSMTMLNNGKPVSRAGLIEREIAAGGKVGTFKGARVLQTTSGSFFDQRTITKTGVDYAEHLTRTKVATPVGPTRGFAALGKGGGVKGLVLFAAATGAAALMSRAGSANAASAPVSMPTRTKAYETHTNGVTRRFDNGRLITRKQG